MAGLLLAHRRALNALAVRDNILDLEGDDITTAQLVVDRQIEHREVALAVCYLELDANQPDVLWPQRRFGWPSSLINDHSFGAASVLLTLHIPPAAFRSAQNRVASSMVANGPTWA
jgi:hypothetical protein